MPHVFINLHQTIYYTNAGYDLSFVTLSLSPRASYACPLVHQLSLSCRVQLFNNLNVLVYSHWGLRALSLLIKHWRHILCNTIFSATLPIVLLCNIMIGHTHEASNSATPYDWVKIQWVLSCFIYSKEWWKQLFEYSNYKIPHFSSCLPSIVFYMCVLALYFVGIAITLAEWIQLNSLLISYWRLLLKFYEQMTMVSD